ncbi:TPA: DUF2919 family protein [Escherichia coli]|nr:DUF2919 family protein [Escherichia coli]
MKYRAKDFDTHGVLRAPGTMWLTLFLQCHLWFLLALDSAGATGCRSLIMQLYPDERSLLAGLLPGLFWGVLLFVYPLRSHLTMLTGIAYTGVLLSATGILIMSLNQAYTQRNTDHLMLWIAFSCMNVACVVQLWPDRRNRDTFLKGGLAKADLNNEADL